MKVFGFVKWLENYLESVPFQLEINDSLEQNDVELFSAEWWNDERRQALFPAGTTARDFYHRKSPTRREQDLNLGRTWDQFLLNEVVQ